MKKLLCALLIGALCALALAGCKKAEPQPAPEADFSPGEVIPGVTAVPEEGGHGEEDQSAALAEMPTLAPVERLDGGDEPAGGEGSDEYYSIEALIEQSTSTKTPEFGTYEEADQPTPRPGSAMVDPSTMQFSALVDTTMGFTFNYPTNWVNLPGVYTVCYREPVEPGDFPARVAITGKLLVHSPEGTVLTDELTAYVRAIYKQYEAKTFQLGTANMQDTFMGRQAVSNTYLAYSGETEVKGFIIGTSVGRRLYVFHFCASYEDYAAMENLMRYMLRSVELIQKDKDK